jgi:DNA invertase Pin-like site-specific DNA recombinase
VVFNTKPAAAHARFSTELQDEKSTEDQIALCRACAARHQLDVVATFADKARSGASVFGRDGLMKLMDAALIGAFLMGTAKSFPQRARSRGSMRILAAGSTTLAPPQRVPPPVGRCFT